MEVATYMLPLFKFLTTSASDPQALEVISKAFSTHVGVYLDGVRNYLLGEKTNLKINRPSSAKNNNSQTTSSDNGYSESFNKF